MYEAEFRYPSEWTENSKAYRTHKSALVARMRSVLERQARGQLDAPLRTLVSRLSVRFFSGEELYNSLLKN
jgi:hypothetical protein